MKSYAIAERPRTGRKPPSFEEALYGHLRGAPWWLASLGAHLVLLLILSVLLGADAAPPARAEAVTASFTDPIPDMEEIPPPVLERLPVDEPEEVIPRDHVPENVVDIIEEPSETPTEDEVRGDPRIDRAGPLLGEGSSTAIGIGGNAAGGGGDPFGGHRTLKGTAGSGILGATEAGLEWLKRHQGPGGLWDCDGFEAMCRTSKCGGPGGPLYDPGVSGLALLAFLGYGETHKTKRYGHVVRDGLKYLKGVQDAEGCFGPRTSQHFTYNHSIAALAMAEAYGLTQSPLFRSSAQNGVDFIQKCRNPYLAWRYGVRPQENDTSVTGWMVMALKSAKLSGLDVDPDAFDGAVAWLDKVTEPEYGRAGYTARGNGPARPQELLDRFPSDRSESLTAVAVLTRIFCGAREDDPMVRKGADLCLKVLPVWDEAAGTIDHYYWYYGSLAMFQVGGEHWKRWRKAMETAILGHQNLEKGSDLHGSWDPAGPWGSEGGRVYSTAMNTLNLEVYYRYGNVFGVR